MSENTAPHPGFPEELRESYEPLRPLGAGAIGTIFLARDRALERKVAIKVLQQSCDRDMRIRFSKAASSLADLKHPSLVQVYVHGFTREGPYLVMEYLEGRSLDRPGELADPLGALLEVAAALELLHRNDLVHRDVKPANLFLTREGRAVLLDFDLVYDPRRTQTQEGVVVGTLAYLAPELLRGFSPVPASDWYSWGVTLFELLEGRKPFEREVLLDCIRGEAPPPPEFHRLDPADPVRGLLRRCLDPDPGARPADLTHIERLLAGSEVRELPASRGLPNSAHALPRPPRDSTRILRRLSESFTLPRATRGAWWVTLVAAAAFLTLGPSPWRATGPSPAPAPPGEVVPDRPGGPFPADYPARVRAEVLRLSEAFLDDADRVVTLDEVPDGAAATLRPLLDSDPAMWSRADRETPELARFHAWIRGGGHPEDLPAELRRRLLDLDVLFRRAGPPAPFHPFLALAPAPSPLPLSALPESDFESLTKRGATRPATGWLATALRSGAELRRDYLRFDSLLEQQRHDELVPPVPAALAPILNTFPRLGISSIVDGVMRVGENRRILHGWLREFCEREAAFLYAAGRGLRDLDGPRGPEAIELGRWAEHHWPLWAVGLRPDPALATGGPPVTPEGWFLQANCWKALTRTPVHSPGDQELRRRSVIAALREAIATSDPTRDRTLRGQALADLFDFMIRNGPAATIQAVFAEHMEGFADLEETRQAEILGKVAACIARLRDPPALGRSREDWVVGRLREVIPKTRSASSRARLETSLGNLEAALAVRRRTP